MKNRKTSLNCAFMQRANVLRRAAMAQLKVARQMPIHFAQKLL
jgi:hypothetical protein